MPAMTQEEIAKLFENAPEGATHYHAISNMFYMFGSSSLGQFWSASRKEWREAGSLYEYSLMFERPAVWSGEGLPPVGIKCEFYLGADEWCRAFTVGIDDDGCMVVQTKNNGYNASLSPLHFRPIRTTEQIAAQERSAAIKEMAEVINSQFSFGWVFEKLHDAGYRKVEGGDK